MIAEENRDAPLVKSKRAGARPPDKTQTEPRDPLARAENEDDDGYDPYSDRPPELEPLFEPDPWG